MPNIRFTSDKTLAKLKPPPKGQTLYWDSKLPGFGLVIGASGTRSFIVQRNVKGSNIVRRITIGKTPPITLEKARKKAGDLLEMMALGTDPRTASKQERAADLTLSRALELFEAGQKTLIRESSLTSYVGSIRRYCPDWLPWKLPDITAARIEAKHREIVKQVADRAKDHYSTGWASANQTLLVNLKIVWNWIQIRYPGLRDWPRKELRQFTTQTSGKVKRRTTRLEREQYPAFYAAVLTQNYLNRKYLLLLMLTGMRRTEAASLRWENLTPIDKPVRLRLPGKSTKTDEQLTIPISDWLREILLEPNTDNSGNQIDPKKYSDWVFPSPKGNRPMVDFRNALKKVMEDANIDSLTFHDFRRGWITEAEEIGIPDSIQRVLTNHAVPRDAHSGYKDPSQEALIAASKRMAEHFRSLCTLPTDPKVEQLPRKKKAA